MTRDDHSSGTPLANTKRLLCSCFVIFILAATVAGFSVVSIPGDNHVDDRLSFQGQGCCRFAMMVVWVDGQLITLRVQLPNNQILAQNLYYNYYYPKPKYLIIGYMDTLG